MCRPVTAPVPPSPPTLDQHEMNESESDISVEEEEDRALDDPLYEEERALDDLSPWFAPRTPIGDVVMQYDENGTIEVSLFVDEERGRGGDDFSHIQTVMDVVGDTRIWTFVDGTLVKIRRTLASGENDGALSSSLLANVVNRP